MAKNKKDTIDSFSGMFGVNTTDISTLKEDPKSDAVVSSKGRPKSKRETKQRKNLALLPSVYEDAKKIAFVDRTSLSEIVGEFLESFVEENREKLKEYERIKNNLCILFNILTLYKLRNGLRSSK